MGYSVEAWAGVASRGRGYATVMIGVFPEGGGPQAGGIEGTPPSALPRNFRISVDNPA